MSHKKKTSSYDDSTPLISASSHRGKNVHLHPQIEIITGRVHPELAHKIAKLLNMPLGKLDLWEFANQETFAKLHDTVRNKDVYIIQPTTWMTGVKKTVSPSDAMLELLIAIRTVASNSPASITAVIPYFGWGQSDKKDQPRVAVLARLMADLLTTAGVDHVVVMDLHSDQIQGFFDPTRVDVDHIFSSQVLVPYVRDFMKKEHFQNPVIASPDAGGVRRAQYIAKLFQTDVAYGSKKRTNNQGAELLEIVGDVKGREVVIWDDLINTGGSLVKFSEKLKAKGAGRIIAVVAHGGLNGAATKILHASPIEKVIITDSMPLSHKEYFVDGKGKQHKTNKILVVSIARLLAEVIWRLNRKESISDLFIEERE